MLAILGKMAILTTLATLAISKVNESKMANMAKMANFLHGHLAILKKRTRAECGALSPRQGSHGETWRLGQRYLKECAPWTP